jgi:hypothetical protein
MMTRLGALTVSVVLLASAAPAADEPAARVKKLLGTWEHSAAGFKVTLEFKADQTLTCRVDGAPAKVLMEADYGVTKDGVVFGLVSKVTKDGTGEGPEKGELFRFEFVPEKNKATLKNLKPAGDDAKTVLEGEYKRLPE